MEQFDTLIPILTVEEMLMYTAELKRPRSEPAAEKRAAVEVRPPATGRTEQLCVCRVRGTQQA